MKNEILRLEGNMGITWHSGEMTPTEKSQIEPYDTWTQVICPTQLHMKANYTSNQMTHAPKN